MNGDLKAVEVTDWGSLVIAVSVDQRPVRQNLTVGRREAWESYTIGLTIALRL